LKQIRIHSIRLDLDDDRDQLKGLAAERLGVAADSIQELKIARRSLDARHKERLVWVYSVDVAVPETIDTTYLAGVSLVEQSDPFAALAAGREPLPGRPIVVGSGPAGLFAAHTLATFGYRPLLIERGPDLRKRVRDVGSFWKGGPHAPESNVLFGEGGAGTFSDGKLTCRSSSPLLPYIMGVLVESRAPESVLYDAHPHVGTDRLRAVLVNLRKRMTEMGVEFRFDTRMDDLLIEDGVAVGVEAGAEPIPAGPVLLAIGHSARDTYERLSSRGVALEFKPFQFGVRVEHPQGLIDRDQYGAACGHPSLGPAEYSLVRKRGKKRRAVFSFCMCPGGVVLPSVSEPGRLCTNGMSKYRRDSGHANSAFVVTIADNEVPGSEPLRGVQFQRHYEELAFRLGGNDYAAPAQSVPDFVRGLVTGRKFQPTYPRGCVEADLRETMPPAVARAIASAFKEFEQKLPGFASGQGTVLGVEARGSSPVRIIRDETTRESVNVKNLYPIGEGAGYAGGIMSAAIDGMKSAMAIIQRYAPPGG